ncbi:unnamed protein product [Closterium sp. Naga37s-1]|nr:unnamed protein product [Closterium sp. Naga37s-1]
MAAIASSSAVRVAAFSLKANSQKKLNGSSFVAGAPLRVSSSAISSRLTMAAEAPEGFSPPELKSDTPSPIFGGSTGGLLRKAQVEEFYVITWESKKEQIFEMPTGGAAIMRSGPNLLKLARKEQCLALGTQLRTKFKINYQFYRVFPSGEVQYLHPKDGVYPEKVNAGRANANVNLRSIGKNVDPAAVKFSGKRAIDLLYRIPSLHPPTSSPPHPLSLPFPSLPRACPYSPRSLPAPTFPSPDSSAQPSCAAEFEPDEGPQPQLLLIKISGTGLGLLRQAPFLQLSTPAAQREGIGVTGGARKGAGEGGGGGRDSWVAGGEQAGGGGEEAVAGGSVAAEFGGGKETGKNEGQCGVGGGEEKLEGCGEAGKAAGMGGMVRESNSCSSSSSSCHVAGYAEGILNLQEQQELGLRGPSVPAQQGSAAIRADSGIYFPQGGSTSPSGGADFPLEGSAESSAGGLGGVGELAGMGGTEPGGGGGGEPLAGAGGGAAAAGGGAGGGAGGWQGRGWARVGHALNEGLLRATQRRLRVDVQLLWRFLQILCLQLREGLRGAASTPIATVTSGRNRSERLAHLFPESLRTRFEAPLFVYTEEKAYLAMSEAAKEMVGVRSVNKSIPAHNRCFGAWWKSVLVDLVVGYDTILMNSLISSRGKGFLYNAHTKELYDLNLAATRGRAAATSFEDVISFKIGVVFTSVFIFFMTLLAVSFTLRETQSRMLKFTIALHHHARHRLPTFRLIAMHILESLVFIPIMIGILFVLFEFYDDQLLAFMVLTLVWLCEIFTLISCRSPLSRRFFPKFFFLFFLLFHVYFFTFTYGFSYLAFATAAAFLNHIAIFLWNRCESSARGYGGVWEGGGLWDHEEEEQWGCADVVGRSADGWNGVSSEGGGVDRAGGGSGWGREQGVRVESCDGYDSDEEEEEEEGGEEEEEEDAGMSDGGEDEEIISVTADVDMGCDGSSIDAVTAPAAAAAAAAAVAASADATGADDSDDVTEKHALSERPLQAGASD